MLTTSLESVGYHMEEATFQRVAVSVEWDPRGPQKQLCGNLYAVCVFRKRLQK